MWVQQWATSSFLQQQISCENQLTASLWVFDCPEYFVVKMTLRAARLFILCHMWLNHILTHVHIYCYVFFLPVSWITSWVSRSQQQPTFSANTGKSFTLKGKLLCFQFVSHFFKIYYCSASGECFQTSLTRPNHGSLPGSFWCNPNGWKTHLSLMTCGCQFQLVSRCVGLRN